jgi:hypothetical protein
MKGTMGRAAARDGGAGGGGELGEETGWQQLVERCGLKAVPRKYMRAWKNYSRASNSVN